MLRYFFNGFLFFISALAYAQDSSMTAQIAAVNVVVTDSMGQVRSNETIIFTSDNGLQYSGRSDKQGKFKIELLTGATYTINVKAIVDTTKKGTISIPALLPGQFFSTPFTVTVKYDPARSYTLDNVHFDFGKASLRPESFPEINELTGYLVDHPGIRIEIAGHTDNVGNATDNLKLSEQRANAIRQYIINKGITPTRIIAKGYGANEPLADNETPEGRQLNRRTEVRIL